ncbi:MAG TPA: twin-arginine translocase TatA/TatE family subunit [Phycisphaerales bacterium]|nr:twin-arginine translocase TatA/TatE family subunit [Phycisphaerales bacterium]
MNTIPQLDLAFIGGLSAWEIGLILLAGILLFGSRLPSVGKNLGRGIVEFKKGLKGVQDEIEEQSNAPRAVEQRPYRAPLAADGADVRVAQGQPVENPQRVN